MSKHSNEDVTRLAEAFKALSNPNRLRIFLQLLSGCTVGGACCSDVDWSRCCVGTFVDDLGLAPSTISHHVKELRQAGLIQVRRCGKTVECWLNETALRPLLDLLTPTPAKPAAAKRKAKKS
jgi:ArsR family transcriptional regulator